MQHRRSDERVLLLRSPALLSLKATVNRMETGGGQAVSPGFSLRVVSAVMIRGMFRTRASMTSRGIADR